ncbi:hypothetical protein ILYODFUR_026527 [Ilyodon furcidens]|uniref:Uncharacterized protein n=1 Tax=Ilyodon furcidens TaxID=33524 RepID=A0ABV0TE91_9TELE
MTDRQQSTGTKTKRKISSPWKTSMGFAWLRVKSISSIGKVKSTWLLIPETCSHEFWSVGRINENPRVFLLLKDVCLRCVVTGLGFQREKGKGGRLQCPFIVHCDIRAVTLLPISCNACGELWSDHNGVYSSR